MHSDSEAIRTASGSGRWFPGDPVELERVVGQCVDSADVSGLSRPILGATVPHAGYVYSGPIAGYTYRALRDAAEAGHVPDVVVVLGFCHRGGFKGLALMDGRAIETPLGQVALASSLGDYLAEGNGVIRFDYGPHVGEHSAENQIPFLQSVLPGTPLIVGLMGDRSPATLGTVVERLAALRQRYRVCILASTDLLHDPDYDRVVSADDMTVAQMAALDDEGLLGRWRPDHQVCCGIGPVIVTLRDAVKAGCPGGVVLCSRNSGDEFPESRGQWVVGYASVVFPAAE